MDTKSYIQRVIEETNRKDQFRQSLSLLIEKYDVCGNVFAMDRRGGYTECVSGYFCEGKTFESLAECVREMRDGQAIRINKNQFILGTLHNTLSECEEGKVLDIERLQYMRE